MDRYCKALEYIDTLTDKMSEIRRDLHKHPETAWLEMRTASIVIEKLEQLGYEVITGEEACCKESRFSLPPEVTMTASYQRARDQGVPLNYLEQVKDGFTAVIGILRCGEGPVVALRFDMDALPMTEEDSFTHLPQQEAFRSIYENSMHACGHDGHITIGLMVADVLMKMKEELKGTVKLIFQPAEEGARGAKSIVDKGHLEDADYLLGAHIQNSSKYDLAPGVSGTMATTKFDVSYHGKTAHAGAEPEDGRNALQAAACAVMNLYGIPRNSKGISRINVGTFHSGNSRNLIPDWAKMELEVRGETTQICDYMEECARRIITNSAQMYDVTCEITQCGGADVIECDHEFMEKIRTICKEKLSDLRITPDNQMEFGVSEDFSYMSARVKERGGKSSYMLLLTPLAGELHKNNYDFNEKVLKKGVQVFSTVVLQLLG